MSKTAFLQAVDNTKLILEGDKVQVIQLAEGLPDEYIAMYTQMLVSMIVWIFHVEFHY